MALRSPRTPEQGPQLTDETGARIGTDVPVALAGLLKIARARAAVAQGDGLLSARAYAVAAGMYQQAVRAVQGIR